MSNASWTPAESPEVLFSEKTWLQGALLTGVGYGIVFTLFCMCFRSLLNNMNRSNYQKKLFFLVYISVMFILGSLFFGACAEMTQLSFIQYRLFPGGPSNYENVEFSIPADEAGNVAFVLTNWCADALIVWRCTIIYKGSRIPTWIAAALPCLMYAAELALGLLWLIQISSPSSSPFQTSAADNINWTLPYLSVAVSLNVVVTLMIVARLLAHRHYMTKVLGPGHVSHYTGVAAMIVESAALYSAFALLFIIPFGVGNSIANTFLQALSQVQIIAPFLIIYRVAQGKGWSDDTTTTMLTNAGSIEIVMKDITRSKNSSGGQLRTGETSVFSTDIDLKPTRAEGQMRDMNRMSELRGGAFDYGHHKEV